MFDRNPEISREPLWVVPVPVQERLQARLRDREYSHFRLCGLYSAVAISFLLFFAFAALGRGETGYAIVIFGFAAATALAYASAWYSHNYVALRHFLTLLMGALCLWLYYSGGTANTGPLYYFVFPLVAVFLQGLRMGALSLLLLLAATLLLETGALGFDAGRYDTLLVVRVIAIYLMVSMLTLLFEYFRVNAEQELLLSLHDLSQVTYGDVGTHLANRRLMEKLLIAEIGRAQRYPVDCCVLLLEPDGGARQRGTAREQQRQALSQILRRELRLQDIPGVWDETRFLVLLPLTELEGAVIVAERLLAECRKPQELPEASGEPLSVSMALASVRQHNAESLLAALGGRLQQAQREGGNRLLVQREAAPERPGVV